MATSANRPSWRDKFYSPLPYDPTQEDSIVSYAGMLVQHRLGDKLMFWPFTPVTGKGKFGAVLEEFYFYKKPDWLSEADFPAGIELKSAPLRMLRSKSLSVKERISLSMINYLELPKETFEGSSFLKKNSKILLVFYIYKKEEQATDGFVQSVLLWKIPVEDIPVIRADWVFIHSLVAANKAAELSEGKTRYLGACTKGAGGGQTRKQLDSTPVKPRAFSLKRSYVQYIYDKHVLKIAVAAPLVKATEPKLFENVIQEAFRRFYGLTGKEIAAKLNLKMAPAAKNFNAAITKKLFKIPMDLDIEEFRKAGIVTKTIRVKRNGTPKEHVSFPYFKPAELVKETWEDSTLKQQFSTRFFFVIYVEDESREYRLTSTRFWAMPETDIDGAAKKVWMETRKRVSAPTKQTMPGSSFNTVAHVRPHARDASDRVVTPGGWSMPKQCFWLDARYLSKELNLKELAGK